MQERVFHGAGLFHDMTPFRDWLSRLLHEGESIQETPPRLSPSEEAGVIADLRAAFDRHALDVAGPRLVFDEPAAFGAARVVAEACWILVATDGTERVALKVGAEPGSPAAHLSADVTLRFLPAVYRRTRARFSEGPLIAELDRVLREWPLSGVLADLDGSPTTLPEFGGHPGLQLLFAERLVRFNRPRWLPANGPAREWAERVYQERNKPMPAPLPASEEEPRD
jgi:hypothetical protein